MSEIVNDVQAKAAIQAQNPPVIGVWREQTGAGGREKRGSRDWGLGG
jgi:hypothetical protein